MPKDLKPLPLDPQEDRDPVDVLADEFAERLRRGETPSVTEYEEKYPELAEQIHELFPSIVLLEQLNSQHESEAEWIERRTQDALPRNTRLGDFEIVRVIGRGGMGIVYEAVQKSLHRPVALKVLSSGAVHSPRQLLRFEREAAAAARLHHTNIVPVFGVGDQDGLHYYVMQLINGQGLDIILAEVTRMIRRKAPLPSSADLSTDSISARELAGVLMSRELADSMLRATSPAAWSSDASRSSHSNTSAIIDPAQAPTVLGSQPTPEIESRSAALPPGATGESVGSRDSLGVVRSELMLRDELSGVGASTSDQPARETAGSVVRSDFLLRDEPSAASTSESPAAVTSPEVQTDTPSGPHLDVSSLGRRYRRNIAKLGLQIAAGLQYAHSQGTLHRDIKPANILLDADGIAWITDFGLAKLLEQDNVTRTGDVVGTLRYMAPEQFRGQTDARSDLYSLGLTLYELLTLRPAFDETDRQTLIAHKLTPGDLPPIRKYCPEISRDLETIVHKCLHFEPDARYQSAAALVSDLQNFLGDRPIQARPISQWERFQRWCRRNPTVALLSGSTALLLLLSTAIASIGYVRESERAQTELGLRTRAQEEQLKAEKTADIALSALDVVYRSFVPDRLTGVVELEADEQRDQLVRMTAISPETAALLEELLPVFDQLAEIRGDDPRYLSASATANRRLGELNLQFNRIDEALAAYERAIETHQLLLRDAEDPSAIRLRIARLRNDVGEVYRHVDRQKSEAAHLEALAMLQSETQGAGRPEVRFELARTHYLLGQRPRFFGGGFGRGSRSNDGRRSGRPEGGERRPEMGQPGAPPPGPPAFEPPRRPDWSHRRTDAVEHLERAILLLEELTMEYPLVADYDYLLAMCLLERSRSPDSDDAEQSDDLIGAVVILEDLVKRLPDEPEYLYQLSEAYERRYWDWWRSRAPAPWQLGGRNADPPTVSVEEVEASLRSALALSSRVIALQPHVSGYSISNANLHRRLAEVLTTQNKLEEAERHLRTAVRVLDDVARRSPEATPFAHGGKVWAQLGLTGLLVQQNKYSQAADLLSGAVAEIEEFRELNADRAWFTNRPLAEMYRALAHVLRQSGDDAGAKDAGQRADHLDPQEQRPPGRPRT